MTASRGILNIGWPAFSSDQLWANCSSVVDASVFRAAATLRSNRSRISARLLSRGDWYRGPLGGARSTDGVVSVITAQPTISAKWLAFQPIVLDLGCAFHSSLSSGTRSSP